jgi:hypothetical protein
VSESSNSGESDGHQNDAGASDAGDRGSAGESAVADSFAAERDALTRQAREWQGRHDRAVAQLEALQTQRDNGGRQEAEENPAHLTVDDFRAELARVREMDRFSTGLREQYPEADPEVFEMVDEFDSPEDFAMVVEFAHNQALQQRSNLRAEVEAEVRAEYEQQFGKLRTAPAAPDGGPPQGALTPESAAELPLGEYLALSKEDRAALRNRQ